jgi:hypothetical protein
MAPVGFEDFWHPLPEGNRVGAVLSLSIAGEVFAAGFPSGIPLPRWGWLTIGK